MPNTRISSIKAHDKQTNFTTIFTVVEMTDYEWCTIKKDINGDLKVVNQLQSVTSTDCKKFCVQHSYMQNG